MRIGSFLWLLTAVLALSALTVWLASTSGLLALLPAVAAVLLVLSVLLRRAH